MKHEAKPSPAKSESQPTPPLPAAPIVYRDSLNSQADADLMMERLRQLTSLTADTHAVHDLSIPLWGKAIANLIPMAETHNLVAQIFIHSPVPLKNGDMVISKPGMGLFVFDVERHTNPSDLFEAHAVKSNPEDGIGHYLKK